MRVKIVVVGHDPKDPLRQMAEHYIKRAGRRLGAELISVKEGKRRKNADDAKICQEEGERLLAASEGMTRVALDAGGAMYSSEAFTAQLAKLQGRGRGVAFLIGGATGLSPDVRKAADVTWSLSPMTMPHRLALCVLAEQLYRAGEIERGGPYHK